MKHLSKDEQKRIQSLVRLALKEGCAVEVWYDDDGHDPEPSQPITTNEEEIYEEIGATGSTTLRLYDRETKSYKGWMYLVHGLEGEELLADYSDNNKMHELTSLWAAGCGEAL